MSYFPCDKILKILYESTPDNAAVKSLLVDMFGDYGKIDSNEVWLRKRSEIPPGSMLELLIAPLQRSKLAEPFTPSVCGISIYQEPVTYEFDQ